METGTNGNVPQIISHDLLAMLWFLNHAKDFFLFVCSICVIKQILICKWFKKVWRGSYDVKF